jgi:AAA-like domain
MSKKFNITGNCKAEKHYMADVSKKLEQVYRMVEVGDYFVINRPRQYGKTTMLFSIADAFRKRNDYIVFSISFEGIGDAIFEDEKVFAPAFIRLLASQATHYAPEITHILKEKEAEVSGLDSLSIALTDIMNQSNSKIILLIDEVDKSSNNQLFVSFLAMLRNKYLVQDEAKTFHSVVLVGVHDVKTLKLKLRPDDEKKYNSPWNIAAEFKVNMNLLPLEIKPMLEEYAHDKGIKLDSTSIAERLFYHTSGYPFLVSKLCKMFDEDILPEKAERTWTVSDVDLTVSQVVRENNTNFESLIKNLEDYPALYELVYKKLVEGENEIYSIHDPIVSLGLIHGIFKNGSGITMHNRIYEAIIYDYMASKARSKVLMTPFAHGKDYKLPDNGLNMETVLLKFQAFMREQYSQKDHDFIERNGRLIFLSFLKPIINGYGYDFKEVQISEERRIDVTITYFHHKYVAELKVWHGEKAHQEGLEQLADYLDRLALSEGYLLIFNKNKRKTWKNSHIEAHGKKIFIVWV